MFFSFVNLFYYVNNMEKKEEKYTLQKFRQFSETIAGLVDDYVLFHFIIDENDGIYIDEHLNITIQPRSFNTDKNHFYPLSYFVRVDEDAIVLDMDAIDELTAKYIDLG